MEQCPVGNRCKKCADRFTSHLVKVSPIIMVRTAAAAAVLGFAFGHAENMLFGGFYMWIIVYLIGFGAGKLLHRVASYKVGRKVVASMIGGLIVGVLVSPARDVMFGQLIPATMNSTTVHGLGDAEGDPEILANSAVKARKHFSEFEAAFKAAKTDEGFRVKVPFDDGEDIDHVWLDVDSIDGDKITGRVGSLPTIDTIEKGDVETVSVKDIEDFMYRDEDNNQKGGFSKNQSANYNWSSSRRVSPYRTSSCWTTLLILIFGIVSPVLALKVRN
jgi:uncharacterized protein YegJ (DUF2314 family)